MTTADVKIAHVTSVHPWKDVRIFHKMCMSLLRAGYDVHLIAPADSNFIFNGVQIHGFPRRTSRIARMAIHPWYVLQLIWRLKPSLVHMHDPELLPIALVLQVLGYKIVFDSHEDYPNNMMEKEWVPFLLRRPLAVFIALLVRIAGRYLSGIVAATPSIALAFGADRTVVVRNYPLLDELQPLESAPIARRPEAFVYVGVVTRLRGVREMVEAMRLLRARKPLAILKIAGNFSPPELRAFLEVTPGWDNVEYHEWLEREAVGVLCSSARGGLVLFAPTPTAKFALPNKLFEYMSAGLPIIASDFPFWREIITPQDCVLFVDPTSPAEIADAMEWLLDHAEEAEAMGRRGRERVLSEFNWSSEERRLLELYDHILRPLRNAA